MQTSTKQIKVIVLSTLGKNSNEENRIRDLFSSFEVTVFPFDRSHKLRSCYQLIRAIQAARPDLVVLEGTGLGGGIALLFSRLFLGVKYVFSSGDAVGPWIRTKSRVLAPIFELYEKVLCRWASGFIGWTPYLVGRALTFGSPRGMTAPGWAPFTQTLEERKTSRKTIRQKLDISDDTLVVGIAGSLVWSKGRGYCYGWELVQAALECQREDICWLIVGDGNGKSRLEDASLGVKKGKVLFTGRIPQHELPAYLAAMDIGSLPQSVDGVGSFRYTTKVSEYLAFQLPIVTSQIPMAYDFPDDWFWRLSGKGPWEKSYISSLARLIESLSWEEVHRKRDSIPEQIDMFDREKQIQRVTHFVVDLLGKSS